jgi:4-amino-4-deoxy-L-arabinose transferase-like glycosyltransferase
VVKRPTLALAAIVALVLLMRLPFLAQPIQGDDVTYLYGAEHAQIDPLHPTHARYAFVGEIVDMRGHPHPPLDAWILGALLAIVGDVHPVPFHLAFTLLSLIAALAMWSLARRFCARPFLATLLFLAVPAFYVSGNSFESDLPLLAFWMAAIALFVRGVDRKSVPVIIVAALAGALAGLAAYQAVLLTPILAVYLLDQKSKWRPAWLALLAAPLTIGAWQLMERLTSGALPAAVLSGYLFTSYGLHTIANTLRSDVALVVHSGWIVSPLLVIAGFARAGKWRIVAACVAALVAAFFDLNPLFWISVGCGVLLLVSVIRRDFLNAWILIFFAAGLIIFFAGAARYLLPIAAPVAILVARAASPRMLALGFALQFPLSLGLAAANYQYAEGYRKFAESLASEAAGRRVWANSEWGLRYYLEAEGAIVPVRDQPTRPGDMIVTSTLGRAVTFNSQVSPLTSTEIVPSVPLRTISLSGRSAFSSSARGLLPFEISSSPVDRVRAEIVMELKPELSYLQPTDPKAASHFLAGLYPDGWMTGRAAVLLKVPEKSSSLSVKLWIPDNSPARHIQLLADGQLVTEATYPAPGSYELSAPYQPKGSTLTVSLTVDQVFSAPGDQRKLGVVIVGVGLR